MALGHLAFLALFVIGTASFDKDRRNNAVGAIVANTKKEIAALHEMSVAAQDRLNSSRFDSKLDAVGQQLKRQFDKQTYSNKLKPFAKYAQESKAHATKAQESNNVSVAAAAFLAAERDLKNLTEVDKELNAIQTNFRNESKLAMDAKLKPELMVADTFLRKAKSQEHFARWTMKPLYGMGDSAENTADALNDNINDNKAVPNIEKLVEIYKLDIAVHAREVTGSLEHELFPDTQDRAATLREVQMRVQNASMHVQVLKGAAPVALSERFPGNATAFVAGFALAAVVVAFAAKFVRVFDLKHARSHEQPLLA